MPRRLPPQTPTFHDYHHQPQPDGKGLLSYRDGILLPDGKPVRQRELATHVHSVSTKVTDLVRAISLTEGENVIIDGTLTWEPLSDQYIDELFASGYEWLEVVDVELSLQAALDRARLRWWWGRQMRGSMGGRFLLEDAIRASYNGKANKWSSAGNAARLAQHAAESLGHGLLRRFDLDQSTGIPALTVEVTYGNNGS